jgi:quaternary ammonium compound-resistance protein SugE
MAWVLLLAAGLLEIVWAYTMKLSMGFTRVGPTVWTILAMLASFALLSISWARPTRCGPASARWAP